MHQLRLSLAILLACWSADAAQGQSFGRWRLPSTTAQVFGYGNGAGHHAPMVRTLGCRPDHVPRVTFVPCNANSRCAAPACTASWTTPQSCGNGPCAVPATPPQPCQPIPYPQPIRHPQIGQAFPTLANPQPVFSPPPAPPKPAQKPTQEALPTPAMPSADPSPKG